MLHNIEKIILLNKNTAFSQSKLTFSKCHFTIPFFLQVTFTFMLTCMARQASSSKITPWIQSPRRLWTRRGAWRCVTAAPGQSTWLLVHGGYIITRSPRPRQRANIWPPAVLWSEEKRTFFRQAISFWDLASCFDWMKLALGNIWMNGSPKVLKRKLGARQRFSFFIFF